MIDHRQAMMLMVKGTSPNAVLILMFLFLQTGSSTAVVKSKRVSAIVSAPVSVTEVDQGVITESTDQTQYSEVCLLEKICQKVLLFIAIR